MDLDDEELKATRMMNGADRNSRVRVNNDIEVNEYVRTKNKGIRKIDRIDNNKTINKYLYFTGKEDFEGGLTYDKRTSNRKTKKDDTNK